MARTAEFALRSQDGAQVLTLSGDWTVWTIAPISHAWSSAIRQAGGGARLDLTGLGRIDMAGAHLIDLARDGESLIGADEGAHKLLDAARAARGGEAKTPAAREPGLVAMLARIGEALVNFGAQARETVGFLGLSLARLGRAVKQPHRIRWASVVHVMETDGFDAVPIVALLGFFVGVVLAYLGSQALTDLGAQLLTVEMVAASMLRAFGTIIAAVLLAGRTVSSFTAQIGTMKMRQEVDALRVLGMDPFDTLVTPRVIALVIMTPILTFITMMAGLAGGLLVCWFYLNISPAFFFDHVHALKASYFWGGIVKAPLFGFVLAQVGCRHGLQTGGDVAALGSRVTSAVVQGIFLIILLNAVLEFWFVGMGW